MSDSQVAWKIIWEHASSGPKPGTPFEIDDVSKAVAEANKSSEGDARRVISGLLTELDRLPDGERFFTCEGNAVVPLPAFTKAIQGSRPAIEVYPFEL